MFTQLENPFVVKALLSSTKNQNQITKHIGYSLQASKEIGLLAATSQGTEVENFLMWCLVSSCIVGLY
jgi:hypothetical protein